MTSINPSLHTQPLPASPARGQRAAKILDPDAYAPALCRQFWKVDFGPSLDFRVLKLDFSETSTYPRLYRVRETVETGWP
jgi:hypothetical protein